MGKVFISYSHKDERWKNMLLPQLLALEKVGLITVWDDRKIDMGEKWYPELKKAMSSAQVSICLISPDYLASDFCIKEEVPYLLVQMVERGMGFLPVMLRPCVWHIHDWLGRIQRFPGNDQTISEDFVGREDGVFRQVAERVLEIVQSISKPILAEEEIIRSPSYKIDVKQLPVGAKTLFGRRKELQTLDDVWDSGQINILTFVAWGGVGKSTLVYSWMERMKVDNFRGAKRVYGWSFYTQGTNEKVTSADQFISQALAWFGDRHTTKGSAWDKGERLAELIAKDRTLLILDGIEPLQSTKEKGKITDLALSVMLSCLAQRNAGLCVITTRETIADIKGYSTKEINLEQISQEAGRALLRVRDVKGTDKELENVTRKFGKHALAVNLLAAYLSTIPGHDVKHVRQIPNIRVRVESGKHPRRVLVAFEKHWGDCAEMDMLKTLGLFDRPVEIKAVKSVVKNTAIPGLTGHLWRLRESGLSRVIDKLRRFKLIDKKSKHGPDMLDCHPIIRQHFAEKLRKTIPKAWKQGHLRLYEYYCNLPESKHPDTIEEMEPLFAAVRHGCIAGKYNDALNVFNERIRRGRTINYSIYELGTIGADRAALMSFLDGSNRPVAQLKESRDQAYVLNELGTVCRVSGQLLNALEANSESVSTCLPPEVQGNLRQAARSAANLVRTQICLGKLLGAEETAEKSVCLAKASGDKFEVHSTLAIYGRVLHLIDKPEKSKACFEESEKVHHCWGTHLYGLQAYHYCCLLIDLHEIDMANTVADRSHFLLVGKSKEKNREKRGLTRDLGLSHLSLGQIKLARDDRAGARHDLDESIDKLVSLSHEDILPEALLTRAHLYYLEHEYALARADLNRAFEIADRGGMRLHLADYHLEYCLLCNAEGKRTEARTHLDDAENMVYEMTYFRRRKDVKELKRRLQG